jgi:hypothetical protein
MPDADDRDDLECKIQKIRKGAGRGELHERLGQRPVGGRGLLAIADRGHPKRAGRRPAMKSLKNAEERATAGSTKGVNAPPEPNETAKESSVL